MSDITTDAERTKMKAIIAEKTTTIGTDWSAAADEYFAWRAKTLNYKQPPAVAQPTPPAIARENAAKTAEDAKHAAIEREREYRRVAEAAVRRRLLDPDSARFEWPFGFMYGYWKPILQKRITGNWTCGRVNARNRMGGYVGSTSFVVVLDDAGSPAYVEVGTGKEYDFTELGCLKATKILPQASPEVGDLTSAAPQPTSVADELAKLAALKERGILTQAEFDAQKAKLLNENR